MSLSWSIDRRILCTQGDLEQREPEGLGRLGQDFRSARQAPPSPQPRTGSKLICDHSGQRETPMKTTESQDPTLRWELFIRQRGSATQGVPPGKEALTWVANTVTLIWGERDALLVDTFLSGAQTTELADWIEKQGRTLRTIYLTHGHPDHFFGLNLLLQRFPQARAVARPNVVRAMRTAAAPDVVANNWSRRWPGQIPERLTIAAE